MNKGFTLAELMVSMSIFTVIIGVVYLSFITGLSAREKAESNALVSQEARIAIDRISYDLRSAFTLLNDPSGTYSFEGIDSSEADTPGDVIRFISVSRSRDLKDIIPKRVTYYIEQDTDRILHILKRKEEGAVPISGTESRTVINNVWELDFAFYSKDEGWLNSWEQKGLPIMVRVTITIGNPKNLQIREDFITTVALPSGQEFRFE